MYERSYLIEINYEDYDIEIFYSGSENIRIQSNENNNGKYVMIEVPKHILGKFIEMIK